MSEIIGNGIFVGGGGGSTKWIIPVSVIQSSNIVSEFQVDVNFNVVSASNLTVHNLKVNFDRDFDSDQGISVDLGENNHSCTVYAILKSRFTGGDPTMLAVAYAYTNGNQPAFFTRNSILYTTVYRQDESTGLSSQIYHVLALSIDASTKTAKYYVDGSLVSTKTYANSGRYVCFNGYRLPDYPNIAGKEGSIMYGSVVDGVESDSAIIANMQRLMSEYGITA